MSKSKSGFAETFARYSTQLSYDKGLRQGTYDKISRNGKKIDVIQILDHYLVKPCPTVSQIDSTREKRVRNWHNFRDISVDAA